MKKLLIIVLALVTLPIYADATDIEVGSPAYNWLLQWTGAQTVAKISWREMHSAFAASSEESQVRMGVLPVKKGNIHVVSYSYLTNTDYIAIYSFVIYSDSNRDIRKYEVVAQLYYKNTLVAELGGVDASEHIYKHYAGLVGRQ